jgi:ABC-2 type transport system ATP-binding protein
MYAIEAMGLSKSFNGVRAVDGIDLMVDTGDVVALLGPNGAGKTTTLMMLLGITEPDAGRIRLLGHPLPGERTQALERTNFTASYLDLPDSMRVRQILEVYGDIFGAARGRMTELAELFGIAHLLGRHKAQISSGQKTLIGLVKALLNRPDLLVLDEPTASLDPEVAARIRQILMDVHREERFTMLVTSHNMAEIERMCRRAVFLAGGRVVADGSPADIASRYGARDLEDTFLSIAQEARR